MRTRTSSLAALLALAAAVPLLLGAGRAPEAPASVSAGADAGPHAVVVDCLRCHESLRPVLERAVAHQPVKDGACSACHAPHASRYPKMLNSRERALCFSCHKEQSTEFMKGYVHKPVQDGTCTACHEVHGSEHEGLLVREGNDLCLGCHTKQREQLAMPKVHAAVADGNCTDCHKPHNSAQDSLLMAAPKALCTLCHSPGDEKVKEKHSGIPIEGTDCTSCHEPHGTKGDALIWENAHPPFAEGSCDLCHLLDGPNPKVVRATGARLCGACHKDVPRPQDTLVHKPVRDGQCGACHEPHASKHGKLLADAPRAMCLSCHKDLEERARTARFSHPASVQDGRCTACHQPHSSTEEHLLGSGPIRTCIGCHPTAQHGHPLGADRIDPRTGKGITCVTCHDPHGTEFPYQLRGDQTRGLCIECHSGDPDAHGQKTGKQG